jgi:hypothetical protein
MKRLIKIYGLYFAIGIIVFLSLITILYTYNALRTPTYDNWFASIFMIGALILILTKKE